MKRINLKSISERLSNREMKLVTGGKEEGDPLPEFVWGEPDGYCQIAQHCYFAMRCYVFFGDCEVGTCVRSEQC